MKSARLRTFILALLLSGLISGPLHARESVLTVIPSDSIAFVVIHNLADVNLTISDLAKLIQTPAPDLLNLAKATTGLQKGLDDSGDVAIVVTQLEPSPKFMLLLPTSNYADLLTSLKAKESSPGIVAAQVGAFQVVIGQKGNFAAIAHNSDRDDLDRFLAATTNVSADAQLATWLEPNKISAVATSTGVKVLIPRAIARLKTIQQQTQQSPAPKASVTANELQIFSDLLNASQTEVDQLAIGLRVDSAHNTDLVERVQLTPSGKWATWAASMTPADNLLASLPPGPIIIAGGILYPAGFKDEMLNALDRIIQASRADKLTPEQSQKYVDVTKQFSHGAHSAEILLSAPQPDDPIISNLLMVIHYDRSTKDFLDEDEHALTALQQLAAEVNSPAILPSTFQRIQVGGIDALEIVTKLADPQQLGKPNAERRTLIQTMTYGPNREMKRYLAAADDRTMVSACASPDRLQAGIDFYKSNQPGLANDPQVSQVTTLLPAGAQMVGLINLTNVINITRQFAAAVPAAQAAIPAFPDSPPIGMAAIATPIGVEGHLVITADTLQSIGIGAAQSRARAAARTSTTP